MTIRPIQVAIAQEGKSQLDEATIIVGLEDEGGGEYITIQSSSPECSTDHKISIDPDEWAYVVKAVNLLLKTAIGAKS